MRIRRGLDDTTAEAVVSGRAPAERPDLAGLADFVGEVRTLGDGPAPAAVGRLAELLDAGLDTGIVDGRTPLTTGARKRNHMLTKRPAAKLGSAAFAAKTGAGVTVALMALTGAAAADVLPQQVQDRVATAVEAVTPADLPDSKDDNRGGVSEENKHQGRDAHQKPKATPTATSSVGHGRPASPGQQGLDQANSGPAAGKAPTAVPSPGGNRPTARPTQQGSRPSERPAGRPSDRGTAAPSESPAPRPTATPGGHGRPASPGSQGNGRPAPAPSAAPTS